MLREAVQCETWGVGAGGGDNTHEPEGVGEITALGLLSLNTLPLGVPRGPGVHGAQMSRVRGDECCPRAVAYQWNGTGLRSKAPHLLVLPVPLLCWKRGKPPTHFSREFY